MINGPLFLIGPDGVGKTTQIELLILELSKQGVNCEYKWLRFNHFFSLPLLAMARFLGLSEIQTLESGNKLGYHYFYKSSLISNMYMLLFLLDTIINNFFKVFIPIKIFKKQILYDRGVYDTLVDLMVSTKKFGIYNTLIGKLFLRLVPKNSSIIMLITDEKTLRSRRDDVFHDETLELKIQLYNDISKAFNLAVIDAKLPISTVQCRIMKKVGVN